MDYGKFIKSIGFLFENCACVDNIPINDFVKFKIKGISQQIRDGIKYNLADHIEIIIDKKANEKLYNFYEGYDGYGNLFNRILSGNDIGVIIVNYDNSEFETYCPNYYNVEDSLNYELINSNLNQTSFIDKSTGNLHIIIKKCGIFKRIEYYLGLLKCKIEIKLKEIEL